MVIPLVLLAGIVALGRGGWRTAPLIVIAVLAKKGQSPTGQDYDMMLRLSLLGDWLYVPGICATTRR